ncbi:MAG: hypothetical protein A3I05_08665 [Deltaproteobacteria bacterium RIFCSPLOWO2_02_FULL_44_10]|nr:MAG: hypothetical protein A3C46_02200 [Deltaproteobacteria bacterium RIFCSPHIGHO2_02_FULL_44_16]OGQ45799.1 MAG: hypothetical protein A3I05_08665 [Deltaproteobacteria bacterium RIFCSPLOWO2_02_FULL_44_10]
MRKFLDPLKRRILLSISRAVVETIKDDEGIQKIQASLLADEVQDNMERFQNYGFTSHPPKDSEGVAVFPGGDRSHGLLIAVDNRKYRLKGLQGGEVAVYTDEGDSIILKRNHHIEVNTQRLTIHATNAVQINTPLVTFNTSVQIDGMLTVNGNIMSSVHISDSIGTMGAIRNIFNQHQHQEHGDGGGITDPPNPQM